VKKQRKNWPNWRAATLRHKYWPRSLLAQSFLAAVPWINVTLVVALFLWVGATIRLRPGVVFELPTAPFSEGFYETITAVLLPDTNDPAANRTLVFFDDERYKLDEPQQQELLSKAMRYAVNRTSRHNLLLLADRRVLHGEIMVMVNLARTAGLQRVNVGIKPD